MFVVHTSVACPSSMNTFVPKRHGLLYAGSAAILLRAVSEGYERVKSNLRLLKPSNSPTRLNSSEDDCDSPRPPAYVYVYGRSSQQHSSVCSSVGHGPRPEVDSSKHVDFFSTRFSVGRISEGIGCLFDAIE